MRLQYPVKIRCQLHLTYMQSTSCKILGWVKHKLESRLKGVPGASTGDPTHDKVMRRRPDKQGFRTRGTPWADPTHDKVMWRDLTSKADQDSRDPLDLLEHLSQTRICLSYCFMPFTNSSDVNRGLSPTTFFWKELT